MTCRVHPRAARPGHVAGTPGWCCAKSGGHDGGMTEQTPKKLDLDGDLVLEQTADDTDAGWGAEALADADPAAVLRRYLDDTPPHHGD